MSLNFKRNYPIILILITLLAVLSFALGGRRVIAYTSQPASAVVKSDGGIDYSGTIKLFDDTVVHSIQVLISDEDYDQMVSTYQQTGLKEYFKADVIIDGVQISDVGVRLKGNASLRTALGGRGNIGAGAGNFQRPAAGQAPENRQRPAGGQMPQMPANGEAPELPAGFEPPADMQLPQDGQAPAGRQAGGGNFPAGMQSTSASGEIKIPFMLKFDEYVDGQTYQGYTNISIRTYGVRYNEALLSEPLTNNAARLAGLPATKTAFTGFQINSEEAKLYVISEVVNETYLEEIFDYSKGVLYKAEVGATLSYQGDNPSSYADSFTQQTRENDADMAPLIAFMKFLEESDDAAFAAELPQRFDVDSFATYLAVCNLLVNTDSIVGMNNNYYLYYNDQSGQFSLLMWDANESMGGLGGGVNTNYDLYFTSQSMRSPGGGTNNLLERFMANETFKALYEEKLKELYLQVFLSQTLSQDIARYSALIHAQGADLVDLTAYEAAVQSELDFVAGRAEYLAGTALLSSVASK